MKIFCLRIISDKTYWYFKKASRTHQRVKYLAETLDELYPEEKQVRAVLECLVTDNPFKASEYEYSLREKEAKK